MLREPFPDNSLEWWSWLARNEWQTLYCMSFALEMADRTQAKTLGALFRETMKYLQDSGLTFVGLRMDGDNLVAKQTDPVDERNQLWETQLRYSAPPDYLSHFPVAVKTIQKLMPETSRKMEILDTLQAAWQRVTEDATVGAHRLSKEEQAVLREWTREFLEWKRGRQN